MLPVGSGSSISELSFNSSVKCKLYSFLTCNALLELHSEPLDGQMDCYPRAFKINLKDSTILAATFFAVTILDN